MIVANLQREEKTDSDQSSEDEISVKAFRQKGGDQSRKKPPWWERKEEIQLKYAKPKEETSREASNRAKEFLETERNRKVHEEQPEASIKASPAYRPAFSRKVRFQTPKPWQTLCSLCLRIGQSTQLWCGT
jgi:hypothetical protein